MTAVYGARALVSLAPCEALAHGSNTRRQRPGKRGHPDYQDSRREDPSQNFKCIMQRLGPHSEDLEA